MQAYKPLSFKRSIRHTIPGLCCSLLPLTGMAASEVYPGAFTVSEPGTQAISLYFYKRKLEGYYVSGLRQGDGELKGHATVLAYTNYGQTAGMPSSWNITLPDIHARRTSGRLPYGFGDATDGLSDVRLAYTFWPIHNVERGRSLGIATHLQIPTAKYDHTQSMNSGDNRWRATVQLGWMQKLTPSLTFEFVPEVTWYSTNRNYVGYRMTQKTAFAATTYLRWRFLPTWETFVGYQANGGGEQTIGGTPQDNETRQKRVFLGVSTGLSKNIYTSLRYSHDTAVNYELKTTSDVVLNLHYFF